MIASFEISATGDVMETFYRTREQIRATLGINVLSSRYIGSASFHSDPPFAAPGTAQCVYLVEIETHDDATAQLSDDIAASLSAGRLCEYLATLARSLPHLPIVCRKFQRVTETTKVIKSTVTNSDRAILFRTDIAA